MTITTLQDSILMQRERLSSLIGEAMQQLAGECAKVIENRNALEQILKKALPELSYCKHLYVLNADGVQLTDNITSNGADPSHSGRNRMDRPYMQGIIDITNFKLSDAYISRNKKRPSLTAIQVIRNRADEIIGFLGADYDLRELPHSGRLYQEPDNWRQVKGDPAIRSGLFLQRRIDSPMDERLDDVLSLMNELMLERGIFHGKFHFSSSRATVWLSDDPFTYRILNIDELTDPDICLAYPPHPYHERAIVPKATIMQIFEMFRKLRFADENVYLRAGSLNVVNGMVGLNFSCDGSHYMRFDEFLEKSIEFWFGTLTIPQDAPNTMT